MQKFVKIVNQLEECIEEDEGHLLRTINSHLISLRINVRSCFVLLVYIFISNVKWVVHFAGPCTLI